MTGDAADGEKAFLKSARATQQAGTGIARYLPGLPEKARDWRFVTERLKDGERLVKASYLAAVYSRADVIDEAEQAVRAIYHGQGWRVAAERFLQLPSWLGCLPMSLGRRPRHGSLAYGANEDASERVRRQPVAAARRMAGPEIGPGEPAGAASPGPAGAARGLVAVRQRRRQLQRGCHREIGIREIGPHAGTGVRARQRRRRSRGHRRRAFVPAHRRSARRCVHRVRQGFSVP